MTWRDINIKQYLEIQKIINDDDLMLTEKNIEIVGVVFGIETDNLSVVEFNRYASQLSFLEEEIEPVKVKDVYTIADKRYTFANDISAISVAQYSDIVEYQKNNDLKGMLSCVLVPEGHKYNDGYDIDFIDSINMVDATSMLFFYQRVWSNFTSLFQGYLEKLMKKIQKDKKMKEEEKNQILEYYQSLCCMLKKPMRGFQM